jgi:H+/Na+-translocating ferredoxin:NAD+ oxidoreductase subunit G
MREMIKMVAVLAVLSTLAGGLLASVHNETREKIEKQILEFVQGPAIRSILEGASNDPINDRFEIKDGDVTRTFFVGVLDGEPRAVTLETFGSGFDGPVGLMVGFDVKGNKLLGAKVTTSTETPGMGARAKTDPNFVPQFKGLPVKDVYKVTQDGGTINALSGATITSRAVCAAATDAAKIYEKMKPEITEKLTQFKK